MVSESDVDVWRSDDFLAKLRCLDALEKKLLAVDRAQGKDTKVRWNNLQLSQPLGRRIVSTAAGDVKVAEIEGFGEPWKVTHKAVMLWDQLDDGKMVGIKKKGSILGIQGHAPEGRLRLSQASNSKYNELWVVSELRGDVYMEKSQHDCLDGCEVDSTFLGMYRDVVDLCYQRIWEENLTTLWQGDQSRLTGRACVEAKLMQPRTKVLHAIGASGAFVGGAIVHSISVPTLCERWATTMTALYIDCCATRPGCHAGTPLWQNMVGMPDVSIVVLHSIMLDSTLSVWARRGMKRVDCSRPADRKWFETSVMVRSQGTHAAKLEDLVSAMPQSDLPLFVFFTGNFALSEEDSAVDAT